jgi:mono/diheme cytochrome c family protein
MTMNISKAVIFLAIASSQAYAADPAVSAQGAKLFGDAGRGKEIVQRWCLGCHSAGPVVDDRIPSLASLAKDSSRTEGAIRAFLMRPHKPMPPLEISTQQIEDIVEFLKTMRP